MQKKLATGNTNFANYKLLNMNKNYSIENPLQNTNNCYTDLLEIVGIPFRACPTWTSFWHSSPIGVFTAKDKSRFWRFPKDRRLLDFQEYPFLCAKVIFFASKRFIGRWSYCNGILIDEFDNIVAESCELNCRPIKKNEMILLDMFSITIKNNIYLFKKIIHINRGGVLLTNECGLYNQNDKLLISGDCYSREIIMHEFSPDFYYLLPSFITLFIACGTGDI